MATSKKIFRQTLLSVLLPFLQSKGFEAWKPKIRAEAPVVYLRRQFGNRRDLLDVQFEKYGRLGCFLNLAQIQGNEIPTMFEGVLPAEQITTGHLREGCRLRGNSFFGMFKAPLHARIFGPERSAKAVAEQILKSFSEAEDWFSSKRVGKHVQCYRL